MTAPEPGPLADELARLIGAAQDWLHRMAGDPATARIATGSPECCWCPICQLIVGLRGQRPELIDRLAEAQSSLAALLRAAADAAGVSQSSEAAAGPTEPQAGRVHKIRLDDAGESG